MSKLPHNQVLDGIVQVNDEIIVKWTTDNEYHHGIVAEILQSGLHRIVYEEDGIVEHVMLEHEQWFFKDPSRNSGIASNLGSPEISDPLSEEVLQRPEDKEGKGEYVPQPGLNLSDRKARRPRGNSSRSSSESVDTRRRSPRLSKKIDSSISFVRRSKRLSSKNTNVAPAPISQDAIVSSADAIMQDVDIDLTSPQVSNTEQAFAMPSQAHSCGTSGSVLLPPPPPVCPNANDMKNALMPNCKLSQEVLMTRVSITPESKGPSLGPGKSDHFISSAPANPTVILGSNILPANPMPPDTDFSSPVPNASASNLSAPNDSLSLTLSQSANQGTKIIPEQKGCKQKSSRGSNDQSLFLLPDDVNVHDAPRNDTKVLERNDSMMQTRPGVSPHVRNCTSPNTSRIKAVSSELVMGIHKKGGVTNASWKSGKGEVQVRSNDGNEIKDYLQLAKKTRSCVIPEKPLRCSHSFLSSHESSNNGLESNLRAESDHRDSSLVKKQPCDPHTQQVVGQSPVISLDVESPLTPLADTIESELSSVPTSSLDSTANNGTLSRDIESLILNKEVSTKRQQREDPKNPNSIAEKEKNRSGHPLTPFEHMNMKRNMDERLKRIVAGSLINYKRHQTRNLSMQFSPSNQVHQPELETPQCRIAVNTLTHKCHATEDKSETQPTGDAARVAEIASSLSPSLPSNLAYETGSNEPGTSVTSSAATACRELEKDNETPVPGTSKLRSNIATKVQLGVTKQILERPSGTPSASASTASQDTRQSPVADKEGTQGESVPDLLTLNQGQPISQENGEGRVRAVAGSTQSQAASCATAKNGMDTRPPFSKGEPHTQSRPTFRISAPQQQLNNQWNGTGSTRTKSGETAMETTPDSRNGKRTRQIVSSETLHIRDVNAKRPFLPAIAGLEKEVAGIDMNLRRLMGQGERRSKEIESLQEKVENGQQQIRQNPTSQEVKSIVEPRACDIRKMLQESMGSVAAGFRNEMREYFCREMKKSLETIALDGHRESACMLSRAVELGLNSKQLLEQVRPDDSPAMRRNEEDEKHN